jgi:hypothetical protein
VPAGAICSCGEPTTRPSRKCERCEGQARTDRELRQSVYGDRRWRACKAIVYERDRWTCVVCGRQDVFNAQHSLDCHHTRSVLELLALGLDPFDPDQVEVRCKVCHGGTRT